MTRRFATLDALRGIAALAVMLRHTIVGPLTLPGGYLGVDLFFGISGFVMALTYEERLRSGLSLGRFMALRCARLWPMLYVGAALGIALAQGWVGLLLLLPDPWSSGSLYPANSAFWSLFFEMIAYVGFALAAPRVGLRGLVALAVASGLALVGFALLSSSPLRFFGGYWALIPHGLARVCYSFTCGVLIYRLRERSGLPRTAATRAWLLPAAFLLIAALEPRLGPLAGLVAILVGFPWVLWLATRWEVPHVAVAEKLSDLSYPLYCIQLPILSAAVFYGVLSPPTWAALIALSLLLDRYWDRPMRRLLRKWVEGPRMEPGIA